MPQNGVGNGFTLLNDAVRRWTQSTTTWSELFIFQWLLGLHHFLAVIWTFSGGRSAGLESNETGHYTETNSFAHAMTLSDPVTSRPITALARAGRPPFFWVNQYFPKIAVHSHRVDTIRIRLRA